MEVRNIPISQLKWIRSDKEREEAPASLFLLPGDRKFPYKNKDGSLNCNLVRAAITRAAQYDYANVEAKASRLYEQYCKAEESESLINVVEMSEADIEGEGFWHNVLPVRKFYDPRYGEINITKTIIKQMEKNFNNGIPHYKPSLYLSHKDRKAYGEVTKLEVRKDGLYAFIVPDDEAKELIKKKRYKYMSAEFLENYSNKDTGDDVGAVFLGVALTNEPAHPSMIPIKVFSDSFNHEGKKEDKSMDLEKLLEETKKELSEERNAKKELEDSVKELSEAKKTLEEEKKQKEEELEKVKKELSEKEKVVFEQKKAKWEKDWIDKGTPSNAVKKFSELVQSEEDMKKFDDVLKEIPKVDLSQRGVEGDQTTKDEYLDEGKKIAESV